MTSRLRVGPNRARIGADEGLSRRRPIRYAAEVDVGEDRASAPRLLLVRGNTYEALEAALKGLLTAELRPLGTGDMAA